MKNDVVETFNSNGEPEQFRAFSSRLKEFLSIYPPSEGYRMVVTATDMLSAKKGLSDLYCIAIQAGNNPVQLGLPDTAQASTQIIFRAELLKGEQVISTASTFGEVEFPDKTWETLETNAKSRLMAGLGVGYELLDADEERHQEQLQKQPKKQKPKVVESQNKPAVAKLSKIATTTDSAVTQKQKAEDKPVSSTQANTSSVGEFPFAENATEDIPEAVLRQLKTLSLNKGVHVNPVKTKEEAKKERKRLMLLS